MAGKEVLLKLALVLSSCLLISSGLAIFKVQISPQTKSIPQPVSVVLKIVPHSLRGQGQLTKKHIANFILASNPLLTYCELAPILDCYFQEAAREQINHDIALSQMILETGFLKYGGVVQPGQHNFAGLGATDSRNPGLSFTSVQEGVQAHIQHLQAYATTVPLKGDCVDPRYHFIARGTAPTIFALTGTWAQDPQYGLKIYRILWRLYLGTE